MLSFGALAAKVFGSANDRKIKSYRPTADEINALEAELEKLTEPELRARTEMFRKQLADGTDLDDLLVPAFATVREAAKRTLGQRHFDVQMIGGMVLHQGKIAEMKTGEGKTLVATLAVYLNALPQRGVHVVTVNDYLAKRDAEWMGRIYKFLGLTVGCIVHELDDDERREQYACDVTYATNNELGFDYLRDNMKMSADEMVQRGHAFAIVDEVDSILIDEARTPLIISGPVEDRAELYNAIDVLMPLIRRSTSSSTRSSARFPSPRPATNSSSSSCARRSCSRATNSYDIENVTVVHHANQALKAHKLFLRDRDYIVKGGEVIIIDEFTGRMMQGRRYSDGLHQALEAKEHVKIQPENQTLASITFQNYFRLYEKLAGMTGTAATEANEFLDIYKLDVLEVPTNMPVDRTDEHDEVYRTVDEKARAIVAEIADCCRRGQPVLVGTTSIEKSEQLSAFLKDRKYIRELGPILQEARRRAQGRQGGRAQAAPHRGRRLSRRARPQEQRRSGTAPGAQRALSRAGSQHHRPGRRSGHRHHRHQHGRPRHGYSARRQRPLPRARLDEGRAGGGPPGGRARRRRRPGTSAQVDRRHSLCRRRLDRDPPEPVDRGQDCGFEQRSGSGERASPESAKRRRSAGRSKATATALSRSAARSPRSSRTAPGSAGRPNGHDEKTYLDWFDAGPAR